MRAGREHGRRRCRCAPAESAADAVADVAADVAALERDPAAAIQCDLADNVRFIAEIDPIAAARPADRTDEAAIDSAPRPKATAEPAS